MLFITPNPLLKPPATHIAAIENELRRLPHLAGDRRLTVRQVRSRCRDARKTETAAEAIGELPSQGEATLLVLSGRFALANFIPATANLAGCAIAELHVATMSWSRRNIEMLCDMIDSGKIGRLWLLGSHYFKGTSPELYNLAAAELGKRSDRAKFLTVRNHGKWLLMKMADGRAFTILSSANLRSCKSLEGAVIFADPELHSFNCGWIEELFAAANKGGSCGN